MVTRCRYLYNNKNKSSCQQKQFRVNSSTGAGTLDVQWVTRFTLIPKSLLNSIYQNLFPRTCYFVYKVSRVESTGTGSNSFLLKFKLWGDFREINNKLL